MKRMGKFLVQVGLCCGTIAMVCVVFSWLSITGHVSGLHEFANAGLLVAMAMAVYLGVIPSLLGGVLWCAGWIIEGFLTPERGLD